MAFFEELSKTLTDTGKGVATKAKALTETIQLRTQISTEKGKLEEAYAAIGKIYYENVREPEEAYEKLYEAVKASRERIAALEIELTQAEGSKICAVCGAKVSKDSLYCGKCGAPIEEEAARPDPDPEKEPVKEASDFVEEATEETAAATAAAVEVEAQRPTVPAAEEEDFEPSEEY